MKTFLALLILVLPLSSFANVITFQCKSAEVEGVHKFDALGVVSIDEYNKVEGVISIQTQKAQAEGSLQIFEELKIQGTHQHFESGTVFANSFDQLTLFTNDTHYIKSLNLLLDFKVNIASQIFSVDNFLFRSNCYVTDLVK